MSITSDRAFASSLEPYQARLILGLRRALYELGWTQAQHSRRAGLHETYVSKIMNGIKTPSQSVEDKLVSATGFPASQVMQWGEERLEALTREKERDVFQRLETERMVEACLAVIRAEATTERDLLRLRDEVQARLEEEGAGEETR